MTEPLIQTKLRRTHLGLRYDIYINGCYRYTVNTAKEINPVIEKLTAS
jgi:hypothetical protein